MVMPPSPRSLGADLNRPVRVGAGRRRRSRSGRGRSGSRSGSGEREDTDTDATLALEDLGITKAHATTQRAAVRPHEPTLQVVVSPPPSRHIATSGITHHGRTPHEPPHKWPHATSQGAASRADTSQVASRHLATSGVMGGTSRAATSQSTSRVASRHLATSGVMGGTSERPPHEPPHEWPHAILQRAASRADQE